MMLPAYKWSLCLFTINYVAPSNYQPYDGTVFVLLLLLSCWFGHLSKMMTMMVMMIMLVNLAVVLSDPNGHILVSQRRLRYLCHNSDAHRGSIVDTARNGKSLGIIPLPKICVTAPVAAVQ